MNEIQVIICVVSVVFILFSCTCSYLWNDFDNPHSVTDTDTGSTEHSTTPRPHPRQSPQHLTAVPGPRQSYQEVPYQPLPGQPGYPAQSGHPSLCDNQAEPMTTLPNHEQLFTLQLPPSYQDATGPAYPLQPMPSSQPVYLLNSLAQPQPNALPDSTDFLAHSICSPEFVLHK